MLGCRPHLRESSILFDPKVPERGVTATDIVIQFRQEVGELVYEKLRAFWQKRFATEYRRTSGFYEVGGWAFSLVAYDPFSNEVIGFSTTDWTPGQCETVENNLDATFSSDLLGTIESESVQACASAAETYFYFSKPISGDRFCVDGERSFSSTWWIPRTSVFRSRAHLFGEAKRPEYCVSGKIEELPPTTDCLVIPSLPNVTSVTFQLVNQGTTGIDSNPNPGGGRRIFPDSDMPGETVNRQQVKVTARIEDNQPGVTVYFRNYDLDDPSNDPVIDPNGSDGDDNNGAVNGSSAGQLSQTSAVTNSNGEASVIFTVTRQPGDNFAIAASIDRSVLLAVTVNGIELIRGNGASIDINCDGTDLVCRSEMLTVWRRLHLEVDRMALARENNVRGTLTDTRKLSSGNQTLGLSVSNIEPNRFENGRLVINGASGIRSYPVIDAFFDQISGTWTSTANTTNSVTIFNNQGVFSINAGDQFTLYDDDDMDDDDHPTLNGDENDSMPIPDTGLIENSHSMCPDAHTANNCNVFAAAYVRPTYDLLGEIVNAFNSNVDDGLIGSYRSLYFQNSATEASETFWTVYLLGAYQYRTNSDGDPGEEGGVLGVVDQLNGVGGAVFFEMNRPTEYAVMPGWDTRPVARRFTIAHEIGHLFFWRA
jgi:hypothetical protein